MNKEESLNNEAASTLLGLQGFATVFRQAMAKAPVSISPQAAQVVSEIASQEVAKAVGSQSYTRPQRIFASKVSELSTQAKHDIQQGNAKFSDGERYIAHRLLSAAGTEELLRNKPQAEVGVTNFDEGRMPAGSNLLVSAIALEFGSHATETNVDNIHYSNVVDAGGIPTSLMNAEIEISANGKIIVPSIPVSKFFSANGAAMGNNQGRRVVEIEAPKLIKENDIVGITLRKPANGTLGAVANNFVKVSLIGPETSTK